ncbi:MAG: hypothetical protein EA376_08415 [Phycisphaeraceae bacterium]|nr:MAG: hypothetical protein EA376_08415 [Phycisphaeraceae bacterium]
MSQNLTRRQLSAIIPAVVCALYAAPSSDARQTRDRETYDIEEVEAPRPWAIRFDTAFKHTLKHDLDDEGDVSITRAGLQVGFGLPLSERSMFNFDIDGEYSNYNFGGATTLAPDSTDPFDDFYSTSITPSIFIQLEEQWTALVGGNVTFAGESNARISDSITGNIFATFGRHLSPDLFLAAGILVSTRLEDDVRVIPLIGVDWRFHEQWRLHSQGAGARLTYEATESLDLSLRGRWESREYRLSSSSDALSRGAFLDDRILISAEAAWRPSDRMSVKVEGGASVYERFKTLDRRGDRVSRQVNDPAPFFGINVSIAF